MIFRTSIPAAFALFCGAVVVNAQSPGATGPTPAQVEAIVKNIMGAPAPLTSLSSRASTEVTLTGRMVGGRWFPLAAMISGPATVRIDYGQPHLRGRTAFGTGGVEAFDKVWRTGANASTQLTTDVDITIGTALIPAGTYSLYTLPSERGWKLIVNKQTRQWGTEYDSTQDLVRIDLATRTLREPVESFTIWLVPSGNSNTAPVAEASGVLKMAWGTMEMSVPWKAGK